MSCSTRPGVKCYMDYARGVLGVKISQSEWHAIRQLANEDQEGHRAKASEEEKAQMERDLKTIGHERVMKGEIDFDTWSFFKNEMMDETAENAPTRGTVNALNYLVANGFQETLDKMNEREASTEVKEPKNEFDPFDPSHSAPLDGVDRSELKMWQRSITGNVGDVSEHVGAKGRARLENGEFWDDNQGGGGYLSLRDEQREVLMVANYLDHVAKELSQMNLTRKERKELKREIKDINLMLIDTAQLASGKVGELTESKREQLVSLAHEASARQAAYSTRSLSFKLSALRCQDAKDRIDKLFKDYSTPDKRTEAKVECVCTPERKCEYHRRLDQGKLTFPG